MKLGSLFSGGGLGDFGFMSAGMDITWQCEIDEYCQKILALRYPESKKYRDIKTLKGAELERVDIITGGFPCQPFSVAGKQKGINDNRHLWPEMFRIVGECRPSWIVGENVTGIINMELETVCADLEKENYEVWPIVFSANALEAHHKRDRVWIVANTKYSGLHEAKEVGKHNENKQEIPPWEKLRLDESKRSGRLWEIADRDRRTNVFRKYWSVEPRVDRVADGCSNRMERLKMLGNGQVPACTYVIGKMIMEIEGK